MPNSLYRQFNAQNQQNSANNFGSFPDVVNKFYEFKNSFRGDPQQVVQQLLQSGQMSQGQYNQLRQMASQFQNLLRRG